MIVVLVTAAHSYTHVSLKQSKSVDLRILSYDRAFRAKRFPRATYIFTDMDRLGFWELELSARLHRQLTASGLRSLNDPARVRQRLALLRRLKDEGLNDFDVIPVDQHQRPSRFPVFLRTQSAHRGVLSGLLFAQDEVDRAVDAALAEGVPRKELILVEYCAEPIREGLFRKLSVYRIGPTMVPSLAVHESRWIAKEGELGIADGPLYDEEHAIVRENRYGDALRPAFEVGEIEYGRADFGLVGGRPQVYEINTNPAIKVAKSHPFPIRLEAARLCAERIDQALATIDTAAAGAVTIDDRVLRQQRKWDRWMSFARWTP
jgi:hypothetical protein